MNQLICHGKCKGVRNRQENFYCLGLNVQGQRDIYESLDDFISGETLNDYNCERCGKKEETVKRMCVGKLNNTLIVHLKRFQFNFDTFSREKVCFSVYYTISLDVPKEKCSV